MADEKSPSPLSHLLDEINRAATGGFPFLAIAMAVALPDICVSLASQDGRTDGARYKEWCKNNLGEEFSFATPDDLYSMRCGVLHNGRFGGLKHNLARLVFVPPNALGQFTNCRARDAYLWSVQTFCLSFTTAVAVWFEKHKSDAMVQANVPRLMQWHPNGLKPYVVGSPVLA